MTYKIAIIGEAHGAQEHLYKKPFVGAAGDFLTRMLGEAGLISGPENEWFKNRNNELWLSNVFNFYPRAIRPNVIADADIDAICLKRKDIPNDYPMPPIKTGMYIDPEFLPELDRLKAELEAVKPNIVIAVGNVACWALLKRTGIEKLRGAITKSVLVPGLKVLPTFHPSYIMRGQYDRRPITIMDLCKAKEASESAEITRVPREIWLEPTLSDLDLFEEKYIKDSSCLAFDIENPEHEAGGQISCIGFAPDPAHAIVVPFFDERKPIYSYWPTLADETSALLWVKRILDSEIPKVGQNGLYDIQHLSRIGVSVRNYRHDTMIAHHSLQPEERKGLGVLGSLYANEDAWKATLNQRGKSKSIKRDH